MYCSPPAGSKSAAGTRHNQARRDAAVALSAMGRARLRREPPRLSCRAYEPDNPRPLDPLPHYRRHDVS